MPTYDEEFLRKKEIPVIYVDTFQIGYDAYRFVLDFFARVPGMEAPNFLVSLTLSPNNAKALIEILKESMSKFENLHGKIR